MNRYKNDRIKILNKELIFWKELALECLRCPEKLIYHVDGEKKSETILKSLEGKYDNINTQGEIINE